ncbi:NUDIX domain-containing protein [Skermania piniformis]|uniref:NUDIX domain-containing protein n=1 Tax=Skermania pinensis TaxID=39122 RepID=A0ABX8S8I7_9ACTN|nr:NUDIX domain-containing protein [Skermania piniformis]QXQ14183.1 NUDIX domain-containing protein [Skermania piniformis]
MVLHSAGILLYRQDADRVRVFLAHIGGPLWAGKDERAWTIPKGLLAADEEPRAAAVREFTEETGAPPPDGELIELGTFRQAGGKRVTAYALCADFDAMTLAGNTFQMEWPPRSGQIREFPEVDRADWFDLDTAADKLVRGQVPMLAALSTLVDGVPTAAADRSEQVPPIDERGEQPDDRGLH